MFGAIAGGIASALAGGAMSKLFGGGQKAASGGIQGDVLATDNNTVGMGDAGIKSAIQGSNVPNPDEAVPSFVSGAMAKAGKGLLEGTLQAGTSAVSDKLLDLVGLGGKSAADKGKDTRDYLAAAFPELNAWERAGADASSAGMVDAGFENQKELTKMQLDNQKEIAEMQNETQKEIAGIQSATSRQNTKDQVYAQNEMLAYQQKESTARVASIMENTNLSKQQQVSEIMRQMLTQAQTAGQYFTNDQIKEMTRKVSAEVDLVHQQTQNQRYGSSHIGATAKDISNVVTDAASGVVDIFHGIDKAVADTWNNFWKDGLTPSQLYVFMPPNLGGFFMVRSYYPSECHADYFDFERIEALKPAIEACGISTLSQSPMLGFHKQMDNRIKLLEEILSFRMQGVEFDNGDMYVDGHKAASDVRDEFVSVTEKLMDELAQCYNVLPQLDINNTIDHRPEGDEKWFLENEKTVTQFCRKLAAERPLKDIRDEYNYPKKKGIKDECSRLLEASTMKSRRGFAIQRLMNAMRQAHADGWFIVFDTLTLADDRLEAFYDNPNALRDYFRDIGRMVLAAEGRKANDSHADCYHMPIAVRYTQDAFSRSGWLWPVDAKGEPLKATSYMAVGFYVAKYVNKKSDMDLAAKGLGAKEWNNSLKTKLSLLPKKLFRIRMSRNFGMKMLTMTNLSTECLIQLTKLGYDATPFNQILKQNAKREMRLRLGKVTVADVLAAQPVTTNLLKFMRASIKMIGVSNLQSFIASMTQKLTLSDISDESKNYLDKAGITTACLRIKSKWTAGGK
ncbi:Similar to Minor spike protein H; acc. no. P03646 [Pyronema omphalodes CBS 100304]|nr:Similar to Minor spike protein H; acc. no. P03646 [Pyronema omphalodes CBS 100304]